MKKWRPDDPCPCRSGEIHKNCCYNNNVIAFPTHLIYNEIIETQEKILDFAYSTFNDELFQFNKDELHTLSDDDEINELIVFFTTVWSIFHVPFEDSNLTIFQEFIKNKSKTFKRSKTLENILKWTDFQPVLGQVKQTNNTHVELQCVFTDKSYYIPIDPGNVPEVKNLLLFFSIEILGKQDKFLSYLIFPEEQYEAIMNGVYDSVNSIQLEEDVNYTALDYIQHDFPDFLIKLFVDILETAETPEEFKWRNPNHETVSNELTDAMEGKYHEDLIGIANALWYIYCEKYSPIVRSSSIFAATLEYIISTLVHFPTKYTQKDVAEKYGIKTNALVNKYHEMYSVLEDEISAITDLIEKDLLQ
ncbi:YecA family protein [Evansella tamaricis]